MHIFISQPMKDLPLEKIRKDRRAVLAKAEISAHKVLDNLNDIDYYNGDREAVHYLADSLNQIAQADLVVFLDGWENARGCKIEKMVCRCYGIKHMGARQYLETIW